MPPSSVKIDWLKRVDTGAGNVWSGSWPVRMAGSADGVTGETPVVFRNQVDSPARSAKAGKVSASMAPCPSSRDTSGKPSKAMSTTGTGILYGDVDRLHGVLQHEVGHR